MAGGVEKKKGLKLFGVRIVGDDEGPASMADDVMRKCASMGNLAGAINTAAVDHSSAGDNGYLSDGGLHQSSRRRRHERKRGIPWTEEEHRTFLAGLQKLGKGDWRGISRNFVTTRTPTQVASHAQKYFLRQSNLNKKKRRSSLFDVVIDGTISAQTTAKSPLRRMSEATEADNQVSQDSLKGSDSGAIKHQEVPALETLDRTLNFSDHTTTSFNTSAVVCSPDLLNLSPPQTHFPTQATASSSIDGSELDLSIAPPQSDTLTKLSSHGVPGIIRVI